METIEIRRCKKCGVDKPADCFFKAYDRKYNKVHKRYECKACARDYCREWAQVNKEYINAKKRAKYAQNPEKEAEKTRKWKSSDPLRYLIKTAKSRAKSKEVPFTLTKEDLLPVPTHCPILGIELAYYQPKATDKNHSASIDRIIPSLGYIRGNVAIISKRANTLKNNATLEELEKIVAWLKGLPK